MRHSERLGQDIPNKELQEQQEVKPADTHFHRPWISKHTKQARNQKVPKPP